MRSCHCFDPHEAPNPPSGGIRDRIAVFQIVFALAGDHRIAEAPAFQRRQVIFVAPHPVNRIQFLGADGHIRFQTYIAIGFQKVIHVVIIPLDGFPVFPGALAFRESSMFLPIFSCA